MITLEQLRTQYKPQILELAKKHKVDNIRVFGSVEVGETREITFDEDLQGLSGKVVSISAKI
jgi:predicted nucleotidyltransferase